MRHTLLYLLFCSSFALIAQAPNNDLCEGAFSLDLGLELECGQSTTSTFEGTSIGATSDFSTPSQVFCTNGDIASPLGPGVWYSFQAAGYDTRIELINLLGGNLLIYEGVNCSNRIFQGCASGGSTYSDLSAETTPGNTYYIHISSLETQGNFILNITSSNYSCNGCYTPDNISFTANPPPFNGTYSSGQEVAFCFTIHYWDVSSTVEWLHALTLDFGQDWDLNSLVTSPPPSCNNVGYWDYYEQWVSCGTGNVFGPGFAYDSSQGLFCDGTPLDGDPGNNWGDGGNGCADIGTTAPPVTFCWQLRADTSSSPILDLSMRASIWSDGDSGSWPQMGCNSGINFSLPATGLSCPVSDPTINILFVCEQGQGAALQILPDGDATSTTPFSIQVRDNMDQLVGGCDLCTGSLTTTAGLLGGSYQIYITNIADNCTRIETITIDPCQLPTIAVSPNISCINQEVTYQLLNAPDSASYQWVFPGGDPILSIDAGPTIQYAATGLYGASLLVTTPDSQYTYAATDIVQIYDSLAADFSIAYTPGSTEVQVTALNGPYASLFWQFEGSINYFGETVTYNYTAPGTYTIKMFATGGCGAQEVTKSITIEIPPDTPTYSSQIIEPCHPTVITFNANNSADGLAYFWLFPGGDPASSTDASVDVTYAQDGIFDVFLRITNASGSNEMLYEDAVSINTTDPIASFDYAFQQGNTTVFFFDESSNAQQYAWDFGDGSSSDQADPIHDFLESGDYAVTLVITNDCGEDTITKTVKVRVPPIPGIVADPQTGCAPLTVQFSAIDQGLENEYYWVFPGGQPFSSNAANVAVTYTNAGAYPVLFGIRNDAGEWSNIYEDYIVLEEAPTAVFDFDYFDDTGQVAFTYTGSSGQNFFWDFGDGQISNEMNPIHTYASTGEYMVSLTVTNSCGEAIQTQMVAFEFSLAPSVSLSPDIGCVPLTVSYSVDNVPPNSQLSWFFPGGSPFTATDPTVTVTYQQAGSFGYILSLITPDDFLLLSDADAVTAQQCLLSPDSVAPPFSRAQIGDIQVYPNPVGSETLWLEATQWPQAGPLQISWLDINGRIVLEEEIDIAEGDSMHAFAQKPSVPGVYGLRIQAPGKSPLMKRIVVQ